MQRVAVARGLGHNPPLLLADEPTANLDHIQAEAIIRLLQSLRDEGRMIVVSTHDSRLVPIADRIVQMVPEGDQHEETPDPRRRRTPRASRCSSRETPPS
jgi:putative ABC transport system ATP-binding protein